MNKTPAKFTTADIIRRITEASPDQGLTPAGRTAAIRKVRANPTRFLAEPSLEHAEDLAAE